MASVEIKAQVVVPLSNRIKFSAVGVKACSRTVEVFSSAEAFQQFASYRKWLIETHGVMVSPVRPNLYALFLNSRKIPKPAKIIPAKTIAGIITNNVIAATFCTICGKQFEPDSVRDESMVCHMQCAHPPFEVNMMEALVGWKGWSINPVNINGVDAGFALVTNAGFSWLPDQAAEGQCEKNCNDDGPPNETCSCGIYAADKREEAHKGIQGEIYGWGRYVRGEKGWRAQYAYPKNFHITDDQMRYFDFLKTFHVPIFIMQPMRLYDPTEEGYEVPHDQYRGAEAHGDSGADEEPDSTEDPGSDEDDET